MNVRELIQILKLVPQDMQVEAGLGEKKVCHPIQFVDTTDEFVVLVADKR